MAANKGNSNIEWKKRERKIAREIVSGISSAKRFAEQEGDSFVRGASRVNTDLAQFAQREMDGQINQGDEGFSVAEFIRSPMYWELREAFVDDAISGDPYAFVRAVWRAYHAGAKPTAQ